MSKINKKQKEKLVEIITQFHKHLVAKKNEGEKLLKLKEAIMGIAPASIVKDLKKENEKVNKSISEGIKKLNEEISDAEVMVEFIIEAVKK